MKRIGIMVLGTLLLLPWGMKRAWAEEAFFGTESAAAVLNDFSLTTEIGKAAVNKTQPGVSQLYDVHSGEWYTGTSFALWQFSDNSIPLGSARAGYGTDYKVYGELQANLPGITPRLIPDKVEGWFTTGVLEKVWSLTGRYGTVGVFAGYDFDDSEEDNNVGGGWMAGVSLGAKVSF